jgi:uncharacterized protein YjiS (DUF1127 family)
MLERFSRWFTLARERRALAQLDERALHDIGLSRADAEEEARRPFWDEDVRAPRPKYHPTVRFTRVPE